MGTWVRVAGAGIVLASVLGCGLTAYLTNAAADELRKSMPYGQSLDADRGYVSGVRWQVDAAWAEALPPILGCVGGCVFGAVVFGAGTYLSGREAVGRRRPGSSRAAEEPRDYDERIRQRKGRRQHRAFAVAQNARGRAEPTSDTELPPLPLAGDPGTRPVSPPEQPSSSTAADPDLTRPLDAASDAPAVYARDGRRYRLGAELARGGMGVVYRADDLTFGREVAVKVVAPELVGGPAARRFVQEAELTGRLQHPGIPPVHDLGTLPDGSPYLAMKLIRGKTLADELKARPTPADDLDRFARVFEQICLAVAYAHARRVIHRDLKPANVMVGSFGEVQVMDWGLAKKLGAADDPVPGGDPDEGWRPDPEGRTRAGAILGTPAYMPPEQAGGRVDEVDERADVFALGGILCAILTGRPPYVAPTGRAAWELAAAANLDDALARLSAVRDAGRLPAVAKRCLSPHPGDRYAHAGEVAAAVHSARMTAEEWKRKDELEAATTTAERDARADRRRSQQAVRLAVGTVFAALLVVGAVGCFATVTLEDARQREEAMKRQVQAERKEYIGAYFPLMVTRAEKEVAANTFKPGWNGDRRVQEMNHLSRQAALLDQPERGLSRVLLAALHTINRDSESADRAWEQGVKEFAPDDPHARVRLAVAAVGQFGGKDTPSELEAVILKRVSGVLKGARPDTLPPDLRTEVEEAIKKLPAK
jgi:serine/threonine protein kinase